jgi:hypothetical protein
MTLRESLAISCCHVCCDYLSLSRLFRQFSDASDGTGSIHKSKLNTNGSFSIGKTWRLSELRGIEVVNVCITIQCILA